MLAPHIYTIKQYTIILRGRLESITQSRSLLDQNHLKFDSRLPFEVTGLPCTNVSLPIGILIITCTAKTHIVPVTPYSHHIATNPYH